MYHFTDFLKNFVQIICFMKLLGNVPCKELMYSYSTLLNEEDRIVGF